MPKEEVILLPLEVISVSCGFAMDLGGSALKLIYRSKEDYCDGKPKKLLDNGLGPMRMVVFAREKIDDLVKYISDHCDITDVNDRTVYSAGMGGNMFKSLIEEKLNIKLENLSEFDCLVSGLKWIITKLPKSQRFHPITEEAKALARRKHKEYKLLAERAPGSFPEGTDIEEIMADNNENNISYPFLLVLCGSAFLLMQINEDGPPKFMEAMTLGGRFYLGAMRLMTGVKDHEKLVEMMTSSDGRSVDMYTSEMTSSDAKDTYSVFQENDINLFPFGKAAFQDKDKIKDGDIVHSFTSVVCTNLVQMCHIAANKAGIKNIFFCGNFVSSQFIQSAIIRDLYTRNAVNTKEEIVDGKFLRYGGHLGTLGAFLYKKDVQ